MNENTDPMPHQAECAAEFAELRTALEREDVAGLARRREPSTTTTPVESTAEEAATRTQRGVAWVRPSELPSLLSAKAAGRGIDFHAELARRSRRLPAQTVQTVQRVGTGRRPISARAHRLPPVTAFGRRGASQMGPTRSGVGLS